MQFDEIFNYIGQYKTYQIIMCMLISSQAILMALQYIAMNILAIEPDFWCQVHRLENFTQDQQKQLVVPYENGQYDRCKVYDIDWYAYSDDELLTNAEEITANATSMKCNAWNFDTSEYPATIVTEWSLVCDKEWYVSTISTVFLAGYMLGAMVVGPIADTFGRKNSLFILTGLQLVMQIAAVFSPDVIILMILRALIAACARAGYSISYILCLELVGPKFRSLAGQQYQVSHAIGCFIFVAISYFIRHFRILMFVSSIPIILYMSLWFVVPESPRWLCSQKRYHEAKTIIEKCAKINKTKLPENFDVTKIGQETEKVQDNETTEKQPKETLGDLLRSPICRASVIWLAINFTLSRMINMATSFGVNKLPGDVYVNLTLMSVFDVPALVIAGYLINRFGRVNTLIAMYSLCFVAMYSAVPLFDIPHLETLASFLSLLGRAFTTATGSIIVIITAELNPTTVRNKSSSLVQGVSLVIVLVGPYISIELTKFWEALPTMIFGSIALVGIFTAMFLPETQGKGMPDTIAEAEKFGTGKLFPWCRKDSGAETTPEGENNEGYEGDSDEEKDKEESVNPKEKKKRVFTISRVPVSLEPSCSKRDGSPSTSSDNKSSDSESGTDSAYDSYQAVDGKNLRKKIKGIRKKIICQQNLDDSDKDTNTADHNNDVSTNPNDIGESGDEIGLSCSTESDGDSSTVSTRL